jgi:hypothetical protein
MGLNHSPNSITNGLVFYFDAKNPRSYVGTGNTCNSLIGSSSAGETVNGPVYNSNGYFSFDGSNDYLRFPNSTNLDVQNFTVEVWVRTNATTQNGFWFEKGTVNTQYSLFQEGGGIQCRINNGSGVINTITVTTANYMTITSWYQVVFTFTTGSQRCYINAAVAGTGTTSATVATNSGGMSIGAYGGYSGSSSYYYNGDQSIAKVYNRVLSAAEIKQNFNALRGRYGI